MLLGRKALHRIELDHEPGEWIEVRRLAWSHLKDARTERSDERARFLNVLDGAEINVKKAQADDPNVPVDSQSKREDKAQDARAEYDMAAILNHGIKAWSYEDTVTAENIAELDPDTADQVFDFLVGVTTIGIEEGKDSGDA